MLKLIKSLFRENEQESDEYSQTQRESIIDLMVLCMYADNHLALKESQIISEISESFTWESATNIESYTHSSISRVSALKSDPSSRKKLIRHIAERLVTDEARDVALGLVDRVFEADSDVSSKEQELSEEIRQIFVKS